MRYRNENWPVDGEYTPTAFTGLSMTALTAGYVSFNNTAAQLQYKINEGSWTDYSTAGTRITLAIGDVLKWQRKVSTAFTGALGQFTLNAQINASGNVMSLLSNNYSSLTDLTGWGSSSIGIFEELFLNLGNLKTAPSLPATTLANFCYRYMFFNSGITLLPELPAPVLKQGCYQQMFQGCTGLTIANDVMDSVTTLDNSCCSLMFRYCTSLIKAPKLKAETLVTGCYALMFEGCTNLSDITCAANAGFSTSAALLNWTSGVSATGTFRKDANTTWPSGDSGIPTGWNIEDI